MIEFLFWWEGGPAALKLKNKVWAWQLPINTYIKTRKDIMEKEQLKRIADAMEEILRLVKKDQEDSAARQRQWDAEKK